MGYQGVSNLKETKKSRGFILLLLLGYCFKNNLFLQFKMSKKKKLSENELENIRKKKRECEQKRRDKIKNNPVLYEEQLKKERERYKARVESGKIKTVGQMNAREQRAQRKKVRQKVKKCREKKKEEIELAQMLNKNTPPESDDEQPPPVFDDDPHVNNALVVNNMPNLWRANASRKESGKRTTKKNKSKCYRELDKAKKKLIESKKRGDKYKKKFYRLREQVANNNSPRTKTRRFLRGENVSPRVRKSLEFSNVLSCQVQENYKTNQCSRKSRKAFSLVLSGKIVKKYKVITMMKDYVGPYYKRLTKLSTGKNIDETLKTVTTYSTKNVKIRRDVVNFFEQDDVSRLEPGKKDCITRFKEKKQKRILMGSLKSLHKKFEVEYEYNIPYSVFCSARPFWVVRANMKYRKTCLCEKHENVELIMRKLKDLKIIQTSDSDMLVKSLCCPPAEGKRTQEKCLERKCENCKDKQIMINTFENKEIEIEQWNRKKETINIKGKDKNVTKVVKEVSKKTIKDTVEMLLNKIPNFMNHLFNIVHQYRTIFELKKNLESNDVLVHIDFSENYICKYAQEIQSVHFGGSHQQITLHTGIAYVKPQDLPLEAIPFCSLSESLKHDAPAIGAHLETILSYIQKHKVQKIENLHFLSDSPATQYRNRHMFFLMQVFLSKFCQNSLTWNYSESGHGKGAPDGVGGTLKRTADRLIAEGRDLASYESLLSALKQETKIKLFSVSHEEIGKVEQVLKPNLLAFKGTMICHQVTLKKEATKLSMRKLSCFKCAPGQTCTHFHLGIYSPVSSDTKNCILFIYWNIYK